MKLEGKNIIIIGASRGLGKSIAEECFRKGMNLILVSRTPPQSFLYTNSDWYSCDLKDDSDTYWIAQRICGQYDEIHAIVNNAATQGCMENISEETSWRTWRETITTNLLSPILLIKMLLERIPDGGKIINMSGGGATSPRPMFSDYATSKAGLVRFSETLACELSDRKIDVNCVAPGAMLSTMTEEVLTLGEQAGKEYKSAVKTKETGGYPKEKIVNLVMFLLSDISNGITGKLISAQWDAWERLAENPNLEAIKNSDAYTLRRIVAKDRKDVWDGLDK